jgi:adenine C2-methylase RlmN of 23S rRNA A2503 and tRNA A37
LPAARFASSEPTAEDTADASSVSDNGSQQLAQAQHNGAKNRGQIRATLCVSSQVGCAMGCTFCATGMLKFTALTAKKGLHKVTHSARFHSTAPACLCSTGTMGLKGNLTAGEIIEQLVHANAMGNRIRNVVFMVSTGRWRSKQDNHLRCRMTSSKQHAGPQCATTSC